MTLRNTATSYGSVTKTLHYIVSILVILMLTVGFFMDDFGNSIKGSVYMIHKLTGLLVLGFMVLFLLWSAISIKPIYPANMHLWEKKLARIIHLFLYLLIIVIALIGWVFTTAAGKAPNFFGLFSIPLPGIPLSKPLAKFLSDVHTKLAWVILGLVILHVVGALKHHFIDRNNLLTRMMGKNKS